MFRSLTLVQQGWLVTSLTFAILIAIGVVSYSSTQQVFENKAALGRTHEKISELSAFLVVLDEAETGTRGFVITGQDEFLEPYRAGKEAALQQGPKLRVLFAADAAQEQKLDELAPLVEERLREIDDTIDARRRSGFEAAQKMVLDPRGRQTMARIRAVVSEMRKKEQATLAVRRAAMDEVLSGMLRTLGSGVVAILIIASAMTVASMRRLRRQLGGAIGRIQRACAELEATASQQVRGAEAQVAAATEVSTTMRELVTTSRQIAESAEYVTSAANETAAAAEGGTLTVANAQQAVEAVRGQVDRIVGHMLDLGKRSQEIGGILDIINDLAEQTNILAINATIEAVGAGEAGRRFGVVASEIRKLADRVGGSTKEIRRLIEEIRAAANTTVMATEDGAKAAETGARRFVEVTHSFQRIADLVGMTAQAARQIVLSTKQQTSAMEQVSSAIGDVAQTARESEGGSAQTVNTSAELAVLTRELGKIMTPSPASASG
jgi:methyl-accepting chemotaxis protein